MCAKKTKRTSSGFDPRPERRIKASPRCFVMIRTMLPADRSFALRVVISLALVLFSSAGAFGAVRRSEVADAVMKRDRVTLRTLLQRKVDVNAAQADGATAIHWAVYNDDPETIDLLIQAGAIVKVKNLDGITPLAMACLYGNTAIIEKLLKAGADPKEKGMSGETTLMLAARNGNPAALRLLLASGVDVNAHESLRGTTALMWA